MDVEIRPKSVQAAPHQLLHGQHKNSQCKVSKGFSSYHHSVITMSTEELGMEMQGRT